MESLVSKQHIADFERFFQAAKRFEKADIRRFKRLESKNLSKHHLTTGGKFHLTPLIHYHLYHDAPE